MAFFTTGLNEVFGIPAITPDSPLIGFTPLVLAWNDALAAHGAVGGVYQIVTAYNRWCQRYNINPDIAIAQACHETGWFTSQRWRDENNPAGLGITAPNTPPNPFATPDEGIRAHIEHLCCYAYTQAACPVVGTAMVDRRHTFHKGEDSIGGLEGTPPDWAVPGTGYVDAIVRIANQVTGGSMTLAPTQADLGYPGFSQYVSFVGDQRAMSDIRWFIMHDTEGSTLSGAVAALSGTSGSAHIVIDKDGSWAYLVPLTTTAFAAGNLPVNDQSINVEQVGFADAHDGGYTEAQYRCAAAFYRWCRANGMTNAPAVYVGKQDADGGPEPDAAGILGHMDVPRDDGKPGWGGNYGHTDPGPTYDFNRLIGYINGAPPLPPGWGYIDGVLLGPGFMQLYLAIAEGTDARRRLLGRLIRGDYPATLVLADGTRVAGVACEWERGGNGVPIRFFWDRSVTAPPWDVRVVLAAAEYIAEGAL